MRAKMRVLVLIGLAVILTAPAMTAMAAPAAVDRGVDRTAERADVLSFDWVHQMLRTWFGDGGENADADPAAVGEVTDTGPASVHAADGSTGDEGNGGPIWDPNG